MKAIFYVGGGGGEGSERREARVGEGRRGGCWGIGPVSLVLKQLLVKASSMRNRGLG